MRKKFVVVVEERDPFGTGSFEAHVAGCTRTSGHAIPDHSHPLVRGGAPERLCGPVVHNDDLYRFGGLLKRAADRPEGHVGTIARGNHDRCHGSHGVPSVSSDAPLRREAADAPARSLDADPLGTFGSTIDVLRAMSLMLDRIPSH